MNEVIIEKISRELREKIRDAKPELEISGTTYYMSSDGDDKNDGLSPETAWKTLDGPYNNFDKIKSGDAVLFHCGDTFRPTYERRYGVRLTPGVTYSSFGDGAKPILLCPPVNAVTLNWKKESDILYSLNIDHELDIGNIVFDNGKEWGFKKVKGQDADTTPMLDLDYFHDVEGHKLYLCSEFGDPATRWKDIEICHCCTVLQGIAQNAIIDGLTIKYAGAFAIHIGSVKYPPNATPYYEVFSGFTVRNCEMEWIGGSIHGNPKKSTTRFGNGFEIWGGGSNLLVENCYFNQCYDAALTQQFSTHGPPGTDTPVTVENSVFRNNLFERNTYDYEYFLTKFDEDRKHKSDTGFGFFNVSFENNICRLNGYDSVISALPVIPPLA